MTDENEGNDLSPELEMPQWQPPSTPSEPPGSPPKKGGKTVVIILAVLLVVAGSAGAAYFLTAEDDPTAAELVASVNKFVAAQKTLSFTGTGRDETSGDFFMNPGDKPRGETGASTVQRFKTEGEVAFPDRSHSKLDMGGLGVSEFLVVGKDVYVRNAQKTSELKDQQWAKLELPPGVVKPETGGPVFDLDDPTSGGPLNMADLLKVGQVPKSFVKEGSVYVLVLKLDPKKVFPDPEQSGTKIDMATMGLRVEKSGKLLGYTISFKGDSIDSTTTLKLKWGGKVTIDAPGEDELDETPGINEAALNSFKDSEILVPAAIPAGWLLDYADVLSAEETTEGCPEASIGYGNPDDPEGGYLDLYLFSSECEGYDPDGGIGSEEFTPGRATEGYISGSDSDGTFAQFVIDGTVVQADTDLTPEEFKQVISSLVKFDPAKKPGEIKGIGIKKEVG